jgi:glycine cleavage system aminomethyltransferase T
MVRADFTVIRMEDRCRMVNGADAGPRDFHYIRRVAQDKGFDVTITDVSEQYVTIGIWGPNAREPAEDRRGPERAPENRSRRSIRSGSPARRSWRSGSPVGEQGWSCTWLRGRHRRLGRLALDRRNRGRRGNLREHPPHGEEFGCRTSTC